MILVYLGRWSYRRFKDDNNIFYKMKNDLTTGTWQDNIWCPIIGGPPQKMWFFQMAPIPLLSVLTFFDSSPHDTLKVLLIKIDQNLPVCCIEHRHVPREQNAPFYMLFWAIFSKVRAHACGTFGVCKTVHMYVWKKYVKFRDMILTLNGPLGLR